MIKLKLGDFMTEINKNLIESTTKRIIAQHGERIEKKEGNFTIKQLNPYLDEFEGHAADLLSGWLGGDSYMFKSPKLWKEIIGNSNRIESVRTWEMDCFEKAWSEWLAVDNEFANGDRQYFDSIIKPYTCFVGIEINLK